MQIIIGVTALAIIFVLAIGLAVANGLQPKGRKLVGRELTR
jgi:hypothetical protein